MEDIYHIPGLFKVGDKVEVVLDVPECEAWHHYSARRLIVGAKTAVIEVNDINGYGLKVPGDPAGVVWTPSCAIERLKVIVPVIMVPSWDAAGGYRA